MKTLPYFLSLFAALALAVAAGPVRAQDSPGAPNDSSVSFQTFYDQLASQGQWINSDQYGYVFQPSESDPNWRPYTYGHWVNTDAGMTWVSDESFGWATYHYGRWTNLAGYGWVWVPGYTWAPAWVSWRDGDDEVGWAPLPPDSGVGIDYYDGGYGADFGFHIGNDCDLAYGIGPWWYNFCPAIYIGDRDCWRHFRDRRDNFGFIHHTRNVTNINFRRGGANGRFGRVHAEGPSVAALNARARTPIETARLAAVSRANETGLRGNTLGVFAPHVDRATVRTSRPASVLGTIANAQVNRGTEIGRPVAVNAASAAQTGFNHAQVATTGTPFSFAAASPNAGQVYYQPSVTRVYPNGNTVANESRFTGEPQRAPVNPARTYAPTPTHQVYSVGQDSYRSSAFYHSQASAPAYRTSSPAYHYSAPAYHPQSSFHSYAPVSQSHYGGVAPAAHYSGGASFGGGSAHAATSGGGNAGGGHAGGGGHR